MRDAGAPLSAADLALVEVASERIRVLLRPARLASFNAWTLAIFGVLTILWALASGGSGLVIGVALMAVAWNEKRGRDLLRALDPAGARILGWNELALAGLVTAYCLVAILRFRSAPDPSMISIIETAGFSLDQITQLVTLLYVSVIVGVVAVQAAFSRYCFLRAPMVEAFKRETPGWIVSLLASRKSG